MNDRSPTGMPLDRDAFSPAQVVEVEISAPIPPLAARDAATGAVYAHAVSLVRLHTMPLGVLDVPVPPRGLSPEEYAGLIWAELGAQINRHLGADGWPSAAGLAPAGLPAP
ncbi:MAG: hypothetical protein JOZ41_21725, partial [Chloroflexi bacterium]|nr:hypothetical protein [Chloroflexota bacterium]